MRPVEASYEDGLLHPTKPLPLRVGERVALIVIRRPDASRWNLERLATTTREDVALSQAGLDDWAAELDAEDHR